MKQLLLVFTELLLGFYLKIINLLMFIDQHTHAFESTQTGYLFKIH